MRFAASLGYEIEELTKEACIKNVGLLDPTNENTAYTLRKLGSMDMGVRERVLKKAAEWGVLGYINNLMAGWQGE